MIEGERLLERALKVEGKIRAALRSSCVVEVRGAGLLLGLRVPERAKALKQHLENAGILVGGSSDPEILRLMPPLNITDEAVAALAEQVHRFT